MERVVYDQMAALDQQHWWYVARRKVLSALIERKLAVPANARVLEIGCGTGHNLAMLGRFGTVDALEVDAVARATAEQRLGRPIMSAPLPGLNGVARASFDMVAALDVIEHVADDGAAVAAIAECLKPGGRFLMTVPAHQWMWSAHDTANHHHRRYSKPALRQLIEQSPLRLEALGYFNSLLFPLAVAQRTAARLSRKQEAEFSLPPPAMNVAFERAFAAERHLIGRVPLPTGLSLFAIAAAT